MVQGLSVHLVFRYEVLIANDAVVERKYRFFFNEILNRCSVFILPIYISTIDIFMLIIIMHFLYLKRILWAHISCNEISIHSSRGQFLPHPSDPIPHGQFLPHPSDPIPHGQWSLPQQRLVGTNLFMINEILSLIVISQFTLTNINQLVHFYFMRGFLNFCITPNNDCFYYWNLLIIIYYYYLIY